MNKKISYKDIKTALLDKRFRDKLPDDFQEDLTKFLNNPGCACNHPFYRRIIAQAKEILYEYFPGRDAVDIAKEAENVMKNHWNVINCHVDELQELLRKLPNGRKQIAIARFEDQATVVINELEI